MGNFFTNSRPGTVCRSMADTVIEMEPPPPPQILPVGPVENHILEGDYHQILEA